MKQVYAVQSKKALFSIALSALVIIVAPTKVSAQNQDSYSGSASNNLPALLMTFTGGMNGSNGSLNWVMENETNNRCFIIERSANGSSFDSIAVVEGLNNSHESDYSFTDDRMLAGNNFYRIRQVSRDGDMKYSKVISLDNTTTSSKMQVFPNPAASVINYTVTSHSADQVTVQVFNLAGVMIASTQQQLSAGVNQQSLAVSTLKSGNYFLKISSREGSIHYVQAFAKI